MVRGPLAYDTGKQLDRGFGVRSDTEVVNYLRPPVLVTPAISAPQMIGAMSTVRSERQWLHGGTHGACPVPMRTAMPGRSDNGKNKLASANPWVNDLNMSKTQLATNPFAIRSFN